MTVETAAQAAYIVAALLFILALAGLVQARDRPHGQRLRHRRHGLALVATIALAIDRDIVRRRPGPAGRRDASIGAAIGLLARPRRRDDRHARADRAAAQLRRSRRRARRLERLPAGRADPDGVEAQVLDRDRALLGIHHAEVFIGVFIGAVTFTGSIVAFLKLSARIKSNPLMLPGKNVLNLGALVAVRRAHGVVRHRPRSCGC